MKFKYNKVINSLQRLVIYQTLSVFVKSYRKLKNIDIYFDFLIKFIYLFLQLKLIIQKALRSVFLL
jgi:hypothetical protein